MPQNFQQRCSSQKKERLNTNKSKHSKVRNGKNVWVSTNKDFSWLLFSLSAWQGEFTPLTFPQCSRAGDPLPPLASLWNSFLLPRSISFICPLSQSLFSCCYGSPVAGINMGRSLLHDSGSIYFGGNSLAHLEDPNQVLQTSTFSNLGLPSA